MAATRELVRILAERRHCLECGAYFLVQREPKNRDGTVAPDGAAKHKCPPKEPTEVLYDYIRKPRPSRAERARRAGVIKLWRTSSK